MRKVFLIIEDRDDMTYLRALLQIGHIDIVGEANTVEEVRGNARMQVEITGVGACFVSGTEPLSSLWGFPKEPTKVLNPKYRAIRVFERGQAGGAPGGRPGSAILIG